MQTGLPQELERDLARAYQAGDLATAIESLTAAFRKRQGESIDQGELSPEQEAKVVRDWHDLLGPGAPEGETADDFLNPIYEARDADHDRDLF